MKVHTIAALTAAVIFMVWAPSLATAFPAYQDVVPNGANVARNGVPCPGFGHQAPGGGGALSAFGPALQAAGHQWTATLCNADSDGDGFSNGMELGDPECLWTAGSTPSRTTGISHPGFADSIPNVRSASSSSASSSSASSSVQSSPNDLSRVVAGSSSSSGSSHESSSQVSTPAPTGDVPALNGTVVFASPWHSFVDEKAFLQYTIHRPTDASDSKSDIIVLTLNTTMPGTYAAIGIAAQESTMAGRLVTAFVSNEGAPIVALWNSKVGTIGSQVTGPNITVIRASSSGALSSSSVSAGVGSSVTVSLPAAEVNVTAGRTQRLLTAVSTFNTERNAPNPHDASGARVYELNMYSGETTMPTVPAASTSSSSSSSASRRVSSSGLSVPLNDGSSSSASSLANGSMTVEVFQSPTYTIVDATTWLSYRLLRNGTSTSTTTTSTTDETGAAISADVIELSFHGRGGPYVAFGTAAAAMGGKVVACHVPATGAALCSAWDTAAWALGARQSVTPVVVKSERKASGEFSVVVSVPMSALGVSMGTQQRVIAARGEYNVAGNKPMYHFTQREVRSLDFRTGTSTMPRATRVVIASPTYAVLNGGTANLSYKITRLVDERSNFTNDMIEFAINATDGFVGFGVSTPPATSGMVGLVLCVAVPASTGTPSAAVWKTHRFGLESRITTVAPQVISGGLVASGGSTWFGVVRIPAAALSIPTNRTAMSRVITAHGPFNATTNTPIFHTNAAAYSLAFYNNRTTMPLVMKAPAATPAPPEAVPTPAPPPTPSPRAVEYDVLVASSQYALVNGRSLFHYRVLRPKPSSSASSSSVNAGNTEDIFEVTLTESHDTYAAFGFATAASGMACRYIACYLPSSSSSSSTSVPVCTVRVTTTYSAGTVISEAMPEVVSGTVAGDRATIVVRVKLSSLGIDVTNSTTQQQRVISARGGWSVATNAPQQHTSSNTASYTLNVYSGAANMPTPAPSTPSPPSTPAPTPIPAGSLTRGASSPIVSQLGGALQYQWSIWRLGSATDLTQTFIELTLMPRGVSTYASFGIGSSQMSGPIVTCAADPTTGAGQCFAFVGTGTSLPGDGTAFPVTVLASGANANGSGRSRITVRIRASDFGVSSGRQRSMFAVGATVAGGFPLRHSGTDRGSSPVDILEGKSIGIDRKYLWIGVGVVAGMLVLWTLVGAALNITGALLRPMASNILGIGSLFLFVVAVLTFGGFTYLDADHNLRSSPISRAFGGAATACFWFLYFPLPKKYGLSTIVGSSFERALPYHAFVGIVVLFVTAAHGVAFAIHRKNDLRSLVQFTAESPPLAGLIAFLLLLIIVPVSVFARRRFYTLFRLVHLLAIPLTVFAILHRPMEVGLGMAPALLLYFGDVFLRVANHWQFHATVHSAKYFPAAKATLLQIQFRQNAPVPEGGSFAVLSIPFAGQGLLMPHPFTIAWFDRATSRATIAVKAIDGGWTEKLANAAGASGASPLIGQHVLFTGHYGKLQVKLGLTKNALLVAGGIGVTPLLSILQEMAEMETPPCSRVVVVWTVRERALVSMLGGLFEQILSRPWVHSILHTTTESTGTHPHPTSAKNEIGDVEMTDAVMSGPTAGLGHHMVGGAQMQMGGHTPNSSGLDNDPLDILITSPPDPRPGSHHQANHQHPGGQGRQAGRQREDKFLSLDDIDIDGMEQRTSTSSYAPPSAPGAGADAKENRQNGIESEHDNGSDSVHGFKEVHSGRPDLTKILRSNFRDEDEVAVYSCGPAPLMAAAAKAAEDRPRTFLHQETFEF